MTDVTELDGVGAARGERLAEAGYGSVEDVAAAEAAALADEASVPEDTALGFIVQAQNLTESDDSGAESDEGAPEDDEGEDGLSPKELAEAAQDDGGSAEGESEEGAEDELLEEYFLPIAFSSNLEYDAYFVALQHEYARRSGSHQPSAEALERVINQARHEGDGVEHTLTEYEINTLHSAVKKQAHDYKGDNMIEQMDAANAVLEQINAVREEELF